MSQRTPEQEAAVEFSKTGKMDFILEAYAGTGKTTTILGMSNEADGPVYIQAFNRSIADELQQKIPKRELKFGFGSTPVLSGATIEADTAHAQGKRIIQSTYGMVEVDGLKYRKIVWNYVKNSLRLYGKAGKAVGDSLYELVDYLRLTLVNPEDKEGLLKIVKRYDIEVPAVIQFVPDIFEEGMRLFKEKKVIDFADMIFLPIYDATIRARIPKYKKVFVDECQDLNRAQYKLATLMVDTGGQMGFVGDRYQAIYGFMGADARMFDLIRDRRQAAVLPLTVCFRCPTSHIELAQKIVPQIRARDGAPEGIIKEMDYEWFLQHAALYPGDLIICRKNAPLVSACVRLIKNGVKARVKGIELGKTLIKIAKKASDEPGYSYDHLPHFVMRWAATEKKRIEENGGSDSKKAQVDDYVLAINSLYHEYRDETRYERDPIKALEAYIESLFKDTDNCVWLSSVHKSKGLEAENVYILMPNIMPMIFPTSTPDERQQEKNLLYVARTRSKNGLYLVYKDEG